MSPKRKYNIPKLAEAIADCLLIISTAVTGYSFLQNNVTVGMISVFTGLLGRIIARLFKDENNDGNPDIFADVRDNSSRTSGNE